MVYELIYYAIKLTTKFDSFSVLITYIDAYLYFVEKCQLIYDQI